MPLIVYCKTHGGTVRNSHMYTCKEFANSQMGGSWFQVCGRALLLLVMVCTTGQLLQYVWFMSIFRAGMTEGNLGVRWRMTPHVLMPHYVIDGELSSNLPAKPI
jgi:hypothetical protein